MPDQAAPTLQDQVNTDPSTMTNQQRLELIAKLKQQALDLQNQIIDHTNQLEQIDEGDAQRQAYVNRNKCLETLQYKV